MMKETEKASATSQGVLTSEKSKQTNFEKFRSPLFIAAAVLGFAWLSHLKKKSPAVVAGVKAAKGSMARSTNLNGDLV